MFTWSGAAIIELMTIILPRMQKDGKTPASKQYIGWWATPSIRRERKCTISRWNTLSRWYKSFLE